MPIRIVVCYLAIVVLIVYSWRRSWFIGVCGAMVLMSAVEHPEMPRTLLGIPGLSPWNFLIVNITLAWLSQRRREGLVWDMPRFLSVLLLLFVGGIFIAGLRLLIDPTIFCPFDVAGIVNESFVNSLKFMLPFYLFYDGCRTRNRTYAAIICTLVMYLLLGALVVKHMGFRGAMSGEELNTRGAKIVRAATGYHRVDIAMMLAGSAWGVLACLSLAESKWLKLAGFLGFLMLVMGVALTGGRTGYLTCGLIGIILGVLRWRRYLLLLPVVALLVVTCMPGVAERMSMGFTSSSGPIVAKNDDDQITSGRTAVWPYALRGIAKSPWLGYGRYGFLRSGISAACEGDLGEYVVHPHCAYLEVLLDNGILGSALIMPIYFVLLALSLSLFRDRSDPVNSAAGGLAAASLLALLIASVGAETFYPREGVAGMWAAAGIMLRRWVDSRSTIESGGEALEEPVDEPDPSHVSIA